MKVLVTGSSGHLGEALVRTLRDTGQQVVGLDIKPSPFTTVVGSITDRECVKTCMADVHTVFHAATLHKPHIVSHSMQEFVETNIHGTLTLLEEAASSQAAAFVMTSTTSAFGDANRPPTDAPAAWITEQVSSIPRNIYGVTKTAAEDLCHLFHRHHGLCCVVLRTSRFFPEEDDDITVRQAFDADNVKANELLFRRVDLEDVVNAHLLAADTISDSKFRRYIISATTPFRSDDVGRLRSDAPSVLRRYFPEYEQVYQRLEWKMFDGIDRVYVNQAARQDLKWQPKYDFAHVLQCLQEGTDPRSPLAVAVGSKSYHSTDFDQESYPVV